MKGDRLFATRPSPTLQADAIITQINEERFIVQMYLTIKTCSGGEINGFD
jgi:hypothetical protein